MRSRSFKLGEETVTLPRGMRVTPKTELRREDGVAPVRMPERPRARTAQAIARERDDPRGDEPRYLADLARLEQVLEGAASRSVLPEAPVIVASSKDLIVATRFLL